MSDTNDQPIEGQITVDEAIQKTEQPKQEAHPNLNAGNPPPLGNIYAQKYKTPEERLAMIDAYCEHIKRGYSDDSFPGCDPETFKRYLKDYASEFGIEVELKLKSARAERRMMLEQIGLNGTMGVPATYKDRDGKLVEAKGKFNDRSWKFIMSNITGWKEKHDVTSGDETIKLPTVFIPKEVEE